MVDIKRNSVTSEFSEFSFENHDASTPIPLKNQFSTTTMSSPTRSTKRIEHLIIENTQLVIENTDLKKQLTEQESIISTLRSEISFLKETNQLEQNNAVSSGLKREHELKKENKEVVKEQNLIQSNQQEAENNIDEIELPPRSSNRTQASPKKSNFPINVDSNTSYDESDRTVTIDNDSRNETRNLVKTRSFNSIVSEEEQKSRGNVISSTPIGSGSTIDWNATLDVLNKLDDSPAGLILESPSRSPTKSPIRLSSQPVSPYNGRIQRSPSPLKDLNSSHSSSTLESADDRMAIPNTYSSSITVNRNNQTNTDERKNRPQELATGSEHDSLLLNSRVNTPISPIRLAGLTKTQQDRNSVYGSVPTTPTGNNQPLSRANLYNQNGTSTQYQAQFDSPFNQSQGISNSPFTPPHLPLRQASQPIKHERFPSDVPLFVEPNQLGTVKPEIITTISGNLNKKSDDPSIIIAVLDRQTNKEIWRFKKSFSQIIQFDLLVRPLIASFSLPPLPDKQLFLSNIPSKVDSRRIRLRDYLLTLFSIPNIPLEVSYNIARFMSLDIVNLLDEMNTDVYKEGWLLRRTKGLGNNWKARYCQIDGPFMNVFEDPGSTLVESLKLSGSQIGKQPDNAKQLDDKNAYRHAFAIIETKKSSKSSKHIFCCETDTNRDEWINVLLQFSDGSTSSNASIYSKGDTSISSQTILEPLDSPRSAIPSPRYATDPSKLDDEYDEVEEALIKDKEKETKKLKMRSFFPFSKKQFQEEMENFKQQQQKELEEQSQSSSNIEKSLYEMNLTHISPNPIAIFQNELNEVINLSHNQLFGREVPSIIYRCLKYLIDLKAFHEEGIFRLNGSSAMIKQLRDQFDKFYDVDFEKLIPKPDINTIAGLLKLWFRELPTTILTKEYQQTFKDSFNNISNPQLLSIEFSKIVKLLPEVNQSILYVLFKFLNEVIQNSDINKMNLRNLCIVFSPTLNIPSEVIIPFLVDFKCIFENGQPIDNNERETLDLNIPSF
ncbi:hypothetical protein WICMUC_000852 [Wickerhamomyces mucosus]|uniref:RhoGAP-domain-containing protein n=1 Tax=Wickerhamomyces mucosus TaxID=1378264 RepID=A0A9P8PY03_9ASCO|nr:hypothetical protein WICMUC_000852 [Wickerhamomyces mucosus]